MVESQRQDVQTLSAQAAEEITRRIATLELDPGATFTERELAAKLGMSKVPVREALLRLSSTGLLSARTGSGYTVAPITLRTARDAFHAWRVVEPECVQLALDRGRGAMLGPALRSALAESPELPPNLRELQFHLGLVVGGANHYLAQGFPHIDVARLLALAARFGEEPGCGTARHEELIALLEAGSPEAPGRARANIDALERQVVDALTTAATVQGVNLVET